MRKISERKRVVVKVGTSTLTHRTGRLNIRRVENLVKTLADLQNAGHEIVLVSSGAIALGKAWNDQTTAGYAGQAGMRCGGTV